MKFVWLSILFCTTVLSAKNIYSFRNYAHVKAFYKEITPYTIEISLKHNLPPASVLALAGLESGFGSGYVSQITGNILSLGAFKGDTELPRLYLPYSKKEKKVLFLQKNISRHSKSDLIWKKRDKSLKKDYRPKPYAGTAQNLELLFYNKKLRDDARKKCINDFGTKWISLNSRYKVFRDAKHWLNQLVENKTKIILLNMKTNTEFIFKIGGKENSFNYRKRWPIKVVKVMHKTGLVKLVKDIYIKKKTFEQAWSNK